MLAVQTVPTSGDVKVVKVPPAVPTFTTVGTAPSVIEVVPVLVTVTVPLLVVTPLAPANNVGFGVENVSTEPDRGTAVTAGVPPIGAVTLTCRVAVFEPVVDGVNVTLIVQVFVPAAAGKVDGQLLVTAKTEPALWLITVGVLTVIAPPLAPLVLVMVTVRGVLVWPLAWNPNASGVAGTVKVGEVAVPPFNVTVEAVATPVTATLSVAVRVVPTGKVGAYVTLMVQFPATGTLPAQVLVCPKLAAFVPVMLAVNGTATVPVLVMVTGCAALRLPICCGPKVSVAGAMVKVGMTVVPVSRTVC